VDRIEKEYLVLAIEWLTQYKEENKFDSDLDELYSFLAKESFSAFGGDVQAAVKTAEKAVLKLQNEYGKEEVLANLLALGVNVCMLLIERGAFKGSKAMTLERLTSSIYAKMERASSNTDEFKNSLRIISTLERLNESAS